MLARAVFPPFLILLAHFLVSPGGGVAVATVPGHYRSPYFFRSHPQRRRTHQRQGVATAAALGNAAVFHHLAGQGLTLRCRIPVTTWAKNGVPLPAPSVTSTAEVAGNSLNFLRLDVGDSGLYTCGDPGRAVTFSAFLFVHPRVGPLNVRVSPNHTTVSEGESVELHCEFSGLPQVAIVWNLMEKPFSSRVMVNGNNLFIHNVRTSDSGTYVCIASNREGNYYTGASNLVVGEQRKDYRETITDPNLIRVDPANFNGLVGSDIRLQCSAITGPDSYVEWSRRKGVISPRATYTKGNHEIIIPDAQVSDSGVYHCIALHESGRFHLRASSEVSISEGSLAGSLTGLAGSTRPPHLHTPSVKPW